MKEEYANSRWILKKSFCWRSNLSNDHENIIPAYTRSEDGYEFKRLGRKMGVENDIFLV